MTKVPNVGLIKISFQKNKFRNIQFTYFFENQNSFYQMWDSYNFCNTATESHPPAGSLHFYSRVVHNATPRARKCICGTTERRLLQLWYAECMARVAERCAAARRITSLCCAGCCSCEEKTCSNEYIYPTHSLCGGGS